MNAIEAWGLTKQFGTHRAVDHISFQVPAGSICGFLGKNGAGKTTTIKMLVGLSKPTDGSMGLMGEPRIFGRIDNSNIGYLPDVPKFYGYMSAAEYLDFCGRLYGMESSRRRSRVSELLNKVDLGQVKTQISGFSRGMKQRLGIAQALMNMPDIIFLDEPISALDPIGRHEVMEILRSLHGKITVFFSTHILSDIENICDYALILDKGRVLAQDSIQNIKKSHASNAAVIRLGSPADGQRFKKIAQKNSDLCIEQKGNLEFVLRGMSTQALGRHIPQMLSSAGICLESYQACVPTLEDIFMEVTAHA